MLSAVGIQGSGLAVCCSAALLSKAGFELRGEVNPTLRAPMLMVSEQTKRLLRDVFGVASLFERAISIKRRVVLWGTAVDPVELPHSALIISEAELLRRLWKAIPVEPMEPDLALGWSLISDRQKLQRMLQHEIGSRNAFTSAVQLHETVSRDTCWVESVKSGWLFLIPGGQDAGSLISVGANADVLLPQSRLVSKQIESLHIATGCFPSHPRIGDPLAGERWIACGTAAVAFDPIAGEGAGHALREGILAAAVIKAASKGLELDHLVAHYTNRLLSGFLRHLHHCIQFYESSPGEWWQSQAQALRKGISWAQNELACRPGGLFRLNGFELENVS